MRKRLGKTVGRWPKTAGLHGLRQGKWSSGKLKVLNGPLTSIVVVYAAKIDQTWFLQGGKGKDSRKCQRKSRELGAVSRLGRRCYSR
jgi:hypothetical protein